MSDAPQAPGWWQAADGKWYPPTEQPPSRPPTPERTGWYRRSVPLWALLATVVAAFVIIAAVAAGTSKQSELDKAKKDLAAARSDASSAHGQVSDAQSVASAAQSSASNAISAAKAALASSDSSSQSALNASKASLDSQAAAQAAQQSSLDAATAGLKASQFGDGVFEVGRDIQAGKYHTDGNTGCYWAKLNSSSTNDIADNDNASGPVTIVINTAYFKSSGCGTWTKIG